MIPYQEDPQFVWSAVTSLLIAIEAATRRNAICPEDGCLLVGEMCCPACQVRNGPGRCEVCPRCTRRTPAVRSVDQDRPFHWVQRGGVMRPVFESEVA